MAGPETSTEELAKKLQNPVAALISVPFQNNFDFGLGPSNDGFRYTLNIQPVIPISLNENWNLISRTILPIISQHNAVGAPIEAGGEFLEAIQPRDYPRIVVVKSAFPRPPPWPGQRKRVPDTWPGDRIRAKAADVTPRLMPFNHRKHTT